MARVKLRKSLRDLSTHLLANKLDLARIDLLGARALLAAADKADTSELGPIDVALAQIESALDPGIN